MTTRVGDAALIVATPAHADVMAALHAEAFPQAAWDAHSFATLLNQPGISGFIEERGGMVLLRVAADEAEILTIGVSARRQGIGRALMAAALLAAKTQGAVTMFLEVAADNAAARGLYAALSFAEAGRRRAYYPNGMDALLLRQDLGA